jgi:hypothetical protein
MANRTPRPCTPANCGDLFVRCGTLSGYSAYGCRCDTCHSAATDYNKAKRAEKKTNATPVEKFNPPRVNGRYPNCLHCGADIPESADPRTRWCSRNCKDSAAWRRQNPTNPVERCAWCNVKMPKGKKPHALYCSRKCKGASYSYNNPATAEENRERYIKERDRRLQHASDYQKTNPDVPRRARNKRRARALKNGVHHITRRDWRRMIRRYDNCCFYCGASGRMTMDHVIPLTRGGKHSIGNVVPACRSCNSSKRSRTIVEWRHGRSAPRKAA